MEFFNNGSRGWETDTCPIVSQNCVGTKFGNFCAARTDTNKFSICQLSSDNEKWGQRGFKIVTALAAATKLEELLG